jgi:hypothetical protein
MTTIHNSTVYALGVSAREFQGFIPPGGSLEVPDDVAREWLKRPTPSVFVAQGLIRHTAIEETPAPAPGNNKPQEDKEKPVHWRTMLKRVAAMDDLDALTNLHATETRPRIITAIETRMAELQG